MNHCINKQKHQWKVHYGMMDVCDACQRIKLHKRTPDGMKNWVSGGSGKVNRFAGIQLDIRVIPRHLR